MSETKGTRTIIADVLIGKDSEGNLGNLTIEGNLKAANFDPESGGGGGGGGVTIVQEMDSTSTDTVLSCKGTYDWATSAFSAITHTHSYNDLTDLPEGGGGGGVTSICGKTGDVTQADIGMVDAVIPADDVTFPTTAAVDNYVEDKLDRFGAAAEYGVAASVSSGGAGLVTSGTVYSFVTGLKATTSTVGVASFNSGSFYVTDGVVAMKPASTNDLGGVKRILYGSGISILSDGSIQLNKKIMNFTTDGATQSYEVAHHLYTMYPLVTLIDEYLGSTPSGGYRIAFADNTKIVVVFDQVPASGKNYKVILVG